MATKRFDNLALNDHLLPVEPSIPLRSVLAKFGRGTPDSSREGLADDSSAAAAPSSDPVLNRASCVSMQPKMLLKK